MESSQMYQPGENQAKDDPNADPSIQGTTPAGNAQATASDAAGSICNPAACSDTPALAAWDHASQPTPPPSVDWTTHNPPVLTPNKNQNPCGTCWNFAVISALESAVAVKDGTLLVLSTQQAIDCLVDGLCGQGNVATQPLYYAQTCGATTESIYPATSHTGPTCLAQQSQTRAKVVSYAAINTGGELALQKAVARTPAVVVVVKTSPDNWASGLVDGVWSGSTCTGGNHLMQLVGYGTTTAGVDYWILRNSWGPQYAPYVKIRRGVGLCNIGGWESYIITDASHT